jgi:phosphinothricin acetyltransferase
MSQDRQDDDPPLETSAAARPPSAPILRPVGEADVPAIAAILNREIAGTTATWTSIPRTEPEIAALLSARREAGYPVLVAAAEGAPAVAYGALGPFRPGEGYAPCAEIAVYVAPAARGRGLGSALVEGLARRARRRGLQALIACVGADNAGSLALFARQGFTEAGRLPAIGRKFGRALDLVMLLRRL